MKPDRLSQIRVVPGVIWLLGKQSQDREWAVLRDEFHRFVRDKGYTLTAEPVEHTRYDEQRQLVELEVSAEGWQS